uniref:(northern house mosquito) hypothetical protein n=1 Tax=Culex pipiens TaxID=7175 RepID=A0A8D8FRC1_CULPI
MSRVWLEHRAAGVDLGRAGTRLQSDPADLYRCAGAVLFQGERGHQRSLSVRRSRRPRQCHQCPVYALVHVVPAASGHEATRGRLLHDLPQVPPTQQNSSR